MVPLTLSELGSLEMMAPTSTYFILSVPGTVRSVRIDIRTPSIAGIQWDAPDITNGMLTNYLITVYPDVSLDIDLPLAQVFIWSFIFRLSVVKSLGTYHCRRIRLVSKSKISPAASNIRSMFERKQQLD